MAQKKTAPAKKSKSKVAAEVPEEEIVDPKILKNKKPLELELPDDPLPLVDDKLDDDGSPGADETDESSGEDSVLDDDELNPFGDKWEQ